MAPPLHALFSPRSIVVIGGSSDPTKIGGRPLQLARQLGYAGRVDVINPAATEVQGFPSYPALDALPELPELAIIALPAAQAVDALAAAAARGIRAAVMFSSGFGEIGAPGARHQARFDEIVRTRGIRVLGPNCLGAMSFNERCFASFSSVPVNLSVTAGDIAILSQSGSMATFILILAAERGLGISRWIALGNEADVHAAECLEYLAADPATRVIVCCLENCQDGPRMLRSLAAARRAGKPVIVLKTGTSDVGQEAARAHTGRLAGTDAVFDAVIRQAGALRARSLDELLDFADAAALAGTRRLEDGIRMALVVTSGGLGVMMADALRAEGIELPEVGAAARDELQAMFPSGSARNPIDITTAGMARLDLYEQAVDIALREPQFNALSLSFTTGPHDPKVRARVETMMRALRARHAERLLVCSAHGPAEFEQAMRKAGWLMLDGPNRLGRAVGALARLAAPRNRGQTTVSQETVVCPQLALAADALRNEHGAAMALAEWGIPVVAQAPATSAAQAEAAAESLGYPVALKILSPDIAHKSDIGAVALDLVDAAALREAFATVMERVKSRAPAARIDGVLVSRMSRGGVEAIVGTTQDPVFGPVVMFGLGGVFVEVLKDVSFRAAPVDAAEAQRMIEEIRGFPVLCGLRGAPPADVGALAKALAALSRFAVAHADAVEAVDINPLVVLPAGQGVLALDALIIPRALPR